MMIINILHVIIGTGRPHQLEATRTYPYSLATARTTAADSMTLVDESKIVLIFCKAMACGKHWTDCYCCINKNLCYQTWDACRSNCPLCNPECSPLPPSFPETAIQGRWTPIEQNSGVSLIQMIGPARASNDQINNVLMHMIDYASALFRCSLEGFELFFSLLS